MDEAWDARYAENFDWFPDAVGAVEPVEIATDYGGSFHWRGTAARNSIESGADPYDVGGGTDGLPMWAECRTVEGEVVTRQLGASHVRRIMSG